MLNTIILLIWDIIFLSIAIVVHTKTLVTIIKSNGWIRVNPAGRDQVSFHAICGSTLILTTATYGILQPAVEWDLVAYILLSIASFFISVLICFITKRLDQAAKDLAVPAVKLRAVKTALRRLDSLRRYSKQCDTWLKDEDFFQREIELVYDGCGYFKRFKFVYWKATGQMLNRANELLVRGDNLMCPSNQLLGGMNSYKKMVIDFIKTPGSGRLGIWGMGGVGKTSLLKLLVGDSRSEDDGNSLQVLLVRVGIGCTSVGRVQEAIATSMKLPLECNETSQAKIIHDHLIKYTSFLLLLDDLWEYLDLEAVGIPWPLGTWRKVVLTSRNMDVCDKMGCDPSSTIQMKCFDEADARDLLRSGWSVFRRVASVKPELSGRGRRRRRRQLSRPPQPDTVLSDVQQPEHPRGMTDYYKKVRSFIECQSEVLMGIWGMRGLGKTTLLRSIHDSYTAGGCFDHIMFVGAGTGHMVSNVQHAIAINLGLDWGTMSSLDELSRGKHIFDHLQHKNFLLLLDDIREPLNWWAIGLPLSLHMRQKIILATRSQAACALMGCANASTMEMRCLGELDAWKLFNDKVELDDHPQLHHLAKQMVSRCGGLPLALCALGRAMSNKIDPREWRSAYSQLTATDLEPGQIDDKVCSIILGPPRKDGSHDAILPDEENIGGWFRPRLRSQPFTIGGVGTSLSPGWEDQRLQPFTIGGVGTPFSPGWEDQRPQPFIIGGVGTSFSSGLEYQHPASLPWAK